MRASTAAPLVFMPEQAYVRSKRAWPSRPVTTFHRGRSAGVGSSKDDLSAFPAEVRRRVGGGLWDARCGIKARFAKPLRGFGGAGVLEIVDDFDGNTYRVVYTVSFARVVYVLHAFQKKSKRGIATPKADLNVIKLRFKRAREDHEK